MFQQPRTKWLNKGYTPQYTSFYNRLARLFPCLIESWNYDWGTKTTIGRTWAKDNSKPRHIAPCSFASSAIQDPVGARTRVRSGWDYQDCTNLFNAVTQHLLPPLVLNFAYCKQTTNIKYQISYPGMHPGCLSPKFHGNNVSTVYLIWLIFSPWQKCIFLAKSLSMRGCGSVHVELCWAAEREFETLSMSSLNRPTWRHPALSNVGHQEANTIKHLSWSSSSSLGWKWSCCWAQAAQCTVWLPLRVSLPTVYPTIHHNSVNC